MISFHVVSFGSRASERVVSQAGPARNGNSDRSYARGSWSYPISSSCAGWSSVSRGYFSKCGSRLQPYGTGCSNPFVLPEQYQRSEE
jgi:hypothetical protein